MINIEDYEIEHKTSTQFGWLTASNSVIVLFENQRAMYEDTVLMIGRLYTIDKNGKDLWYILPNNDKKNEYLRLYHSRNNFRCLSAKSLKERYPQCCI